VSPSPGAARLPGPRLLLGRGTGTSFAFAGDWLPAVANTVKRAAKRAATSRNETGHLLATLIIQPPAGKDVVLAPARRACAVMVSLVLVTVTSVSSRRAMRLRSRAGVVGSFQLAGRSVTSWLIRVFWAAVSRPACCSRALS
jgi:hypothetical protein